MARINCHIGFGGLLGLARADDHYVALIPNLSSKEPFKERLHESFYAAMQPHRPRILVRGGHFATTCDRPILAGDQSTCHPGERSVSWPIDFDDLNLVDPGFTSLPSEPGLSQVSDLLRDPPGTPFDKEISGALFKPKYAEDPPRIIGRVTFRPSRFAVTEFGGIYRFMYLQHPSQAMVRELYFTADVDADEGVLLEVRPLDDSAKPCELRIVPDGQDPFEIHFENSMGGSMGSDNPDFALHYNLCNRPQMLLGRLPYPYRAPHDSTVYLEPRGFNPQCSPAGYGEVP